MGEKREVKKGKQRSYKEHEGSKERKRSKSVKSRRKRIE
jgi:hypothetical protein